MPSCTTPSCPQAWAVGTTRPTAECRALPQRATRATSATGAPSCSFTAGWMACAGAALPALWVTCLASMVTHHATHLPLCAHAALAALIVRRYTFDDSHVGKMEASGVRTAAAYVLFYRRRGSCAVDVDALLAQRAAAQRATLDMCAAPSGQQQQQQQAAAGAGPAAPAASPAADASMLDSQEALEAASQEAAAAHGQPPPPPPLPGSSGSLGSMLGKRAGQPDTIDEELEEDSRDELAPAAGGMPIDLD